RVRQIALVESQLGASEKVVAQLPGILEKINVRDGQRVEKGQPLAVFRNIELEYQLEEARTKFATNQSQAFGLAGLLSTSSVDQSLQAGLQAKITEAQGQAR